MLERIPVRSPLQSERAEARPASHARPAGAAAELALPARNAPQAQTRAPK